MLQGQRRALQRLQGSERTARTQSDPLVYQRGGQRVEFGASARGRDVPVTRRTLIRGCP
jgi:hypothetical protein